MTFRAILFTAVAPLLTLALVTVSGAALNGQAPRGSAALMNPADLNERAPAQFKVNLDTNKGLIVIDVHRDWAPIGADRFYNLIKRGFYGGVRFHRVIPGFMAQFGISGDPAVTKAFLAAYIVDDPPRQSNKRGYVTYAPAGLNRRTTILAIHLIDNPGMDREVAPFGQVVSGMNVVDSLYGGYGDNPPTGKGPDINRYRLEGNAYLEKDFSKLDYIKTATIVE